LQTIKVKHNVEMAHRLYLTSSKCENIHGHSWQIALTLGGEVDDRGMLEGLDFGLVKQTFRKFLDSNYDHRLLLNEEDPFAGSVLLGSGEDLPSLPGLQTFNGDPTTELFARCIGATMIHAFPMCPVISVDVWETRVNCATWSYVKDGS
jgi:6-pyruvoyltetrahydropterin/6-carboxytetrahydropterin synthase